MPVETPSVHPPATPDSDAASTSEPGPGSRPPASRPDRMKPREHGAYAMLTFPVLSGWLVGGLTLPGVAFAGAVLAGFLAHEPVTVLAGGRGRRLAESHAGPARRRLLGTVAGALAAAALFVWTAPPGVLLLAGIPVVGAAGVAAFLAARRVKSVPGEIWVAGTFASVHVPIAAAAGADGAALWLPALVWVGGFVPPTLAVHALKARFKARGRAGEPAGRVPRGWTRIVAPVVAALVVVGAVILALGGRPGALAVLPLAGAAGMVSVVSLHPRNLKRVGWTMVAADIAALILLTALV